MDVNEGLKFPHYSIIPYCLWDGTSWASPQNSITSEKELTVTSSNCLPILGTANVQGENKVLRQEYCHNWSSSATAPLPSTLALPAQFHVWERGRKLEQINKWPFFPAHHSLRAWLPPLNCPRYHWALHSWFIFSQVLSAIRLCQVCMAKASVLTLRRLCWRRYCSAHLYTLSHNVLQWFSSWCAEPTTCCTDRTVSAVRCSLFLTFLPILSLVCQLSVAGTFPVCLSLLHWQRLLNPKILEVSDNQNSHFRAAMF